MTCTAIYWLKDAFNRIDDGIDLSSSLIWFMTLIENYCSKEVYPIIVRNARRNKDESGEVGGWVSGKGEENLYLIQC